MIFLALCVECGRSYPLLCRSGYGGYGRDRRYGGLLESRMHGCGRLFSIACLTVSLNVLLYVLLRTQMFPFVFLLGGCGQIIIEDLRLRVNLDGNDTDTNYECKTYKFANGFKMPKKYINQVQVQMFASGLRNSKIIVYGLTEEDYDNYFNPIDPERLQEYPVTYDVKWINGVYLPKLTYLAECLKEGRFPCV